MTGVQTCALPISGLLAGLDRDRDLELFSYLNQFYQKIKKLEEAEADRKSVV